MIIIKYYDIGIFINRRNSYSIYVAIDHTKVDEDEESILKHLLEINKLDSNEINQVSYIEEVDYEIYNKFNN
jgi:hypothetical protein